MYTKSFFYSRSKNPINFQYILDNHILDRPEYYTDSSGFHDTNVLMLLFNTFVNTSLEYYALIWQPGSKQRIQRKLLKFLAFKAVPIGVPQNYLLKRFAVLTVFV